jgi:signal transduction histidine kinase/CheY-like chemotaxis protein
MGLLMSGDAELRFRSLAETIRALSESTTSFAGLLELIAERATGLVGDACTIALVSEDGDWIHPAEVFGLDEEAAAILRAAFAPQHWPPDTPGLAARVAGTREAVLIPRIDPAELALRVAPEFADAIERIGAHSVLCVPLVARDRAIGALGLVRYRPQSAPFNEEDLALLRAIADGAALALSNARLLDTAQRELREQRRVREEALAFVGLVQSSSDFIAMAGFDGRVLFVNDAGRRLVGLEMDRDVRQLVLADFHTNEGLSRAVLLKAVGRWQGEGVLRDFKTGALIPTQVSSFIARSASGEPLCFATVQRDLRGTRRLETQLRQAQKMEAVGRLAGGIAHDFNNLLCVILSYGSLLSESLPSGSGARAEVEEIRLAGERAAVLTRQLLAFSRQQVLEPKVLALSSVLGGMANMIRRLVAEDIEIRMETDSDLGCVRADEGQIEQVVLNLVLNARDAMADGGTLTIETRNVHLDTGAALQAGIKAGAYVALVVRDTGLGMDEATTAHLFEPFFTTKAKGKGTGLGLSTVMGIVKQSGGHVSVDTQPGKGATFRVFLPRIDGAPPATAPIHTLAVQPAGHGERILLVEDEPQVRVLLRNILERAGYDVVDAANPEDALIECERTERPIHLLLTDVIMPRMNGRQLAEHFVKMRPAGRVLYLSGYADDVLGHHGVLAPGVELLQKPITPESLLRRVRRVLDAPLAV